MAYADLLDDESIDSQYLIVMSPRRIVEDFTVVSGTIYSVFFDYGQVIEVLSDGSPLTEAGSSSVVNGEFYYDTDSSTLYINVGVNPSGVQIIASYELYFGTFDAHWHRLPTDDSTRTVYYEPLIARSPQITNSTSDVLFGFLPTFSATISISNATQFLQRHIYDSSFNRAPIKVFHYLDKLTIDNVKLVLTGFCKSITSSNDSVDLNILDATEIFETQYRNPIGDSFYGSTHFTDIEPGADNKPIRQVFGVVEGFVPINITYVADSPTTNDNRQWICIHDETNLGTITTTVKASPASTTTRTYLTSADGFRVGDTWYNSTVITKFGYVTAVNKTGDHYIEHAAIATPNASGNTIERFFVANVKIVQNGVTYNLIYGRDYGIVTDSIAKVAGFALALNFEGNLGMNTLNPQNDKVFARVYGHKNTTTMGMSSFGSNSAETGVLSNPVVILWYLLTEILGIPESEFNTASFTALESSITDEVGFAIPPTSSEEFDTFKDIILKISQTILTKLFLDNDLKWKISQTGPLGAVDKTLADDEILADKFNYAFDYQDIISRSQVAYNQREMGDDGGQGSPMLVSSESEIARNLHQIERQKTFNSLHFSSSDAQILADRLIYALGDRKGTLSISTKNRFFDTLLDHIIKVSRTRLPGFEYDSEIERERDFSVDETSKSLTEINIVLNDQRGIEENSDDW